VVSGCVCSCSDDGQSASQHSSVLNAPQSCTAFVYLEHSKERDPNYKQQISSMIVLLANVILLSTHFLSFEEKVLFQLEGRVSKQPVEVLLCTTQSGSREISQKSLNLSTVKIVIHLRNPHFHICFVQNR